MRWIGSRLVFFGMATCLVVFLLYGFGIGVPRGVLFWAGAWAPVFYFAATWMLLRRIVRVEVRTKCVPNSDVSPR